MTTNGQTSDLSGRYDEALERFHRTGPEFDGYLSNHGPMAVDVLARRGASERVHRWSDHYLLRLEGMPQAAEPLRPDALEAALGEPARIGDWIAWFEGEFEASPWEDVLERWWPRLLPGIAAGATHGVIRVGHAVQALREEATLPRVRELAQGLGYWAARWQKVPLTCASGSRRATELVATVPRVEHQEGGIAERFAQLPATSRWAEHLRTLHPPLDADDIPAALEAIVDAVVLLYARVAGGAPTMLVHAATAPHAVARALPSLPRALWSASFDAAWSATGAVLAAYLPASPTEGSRAPSSPEEAWDLALAHGGEHVIKLADSALDVHARTGDARALAAIRTAVDLDA